MKVKMDFVSNSSSTSFVYIAKELITKEDFFKAVGVSTESPAAGLFEDMFYEIQSTIASAAEVRSDVEISAFEKEQKFVPEVCEKMRDALRKGLTVKTGEFSSDGGLAEGIMCTEVFEINSERFFINAYDNAW